MTRLGARKCHRNGRSTPLPLLDFLDRLRARALPLPARRLVRLYGLSPAAALAQAQAAGFVCEADR